MGRRVTGLPDPRGGIAASRPVRPPGRTRAGIRPGRGRREAGRAALWFLGGGLLVALAVLFIDRPVAVFAHDTTRHGRIALALASLPHTTALVPCLALLCAGGALAAGMGRNTVLRVGVLAMASFALGEAIKDFLKYAVGRTWPETGWEGNPSFIHDGVFTCFPFHGGEGYASFPSGHMTAASTVMVTAWLLLPRGRPLWAAVLLGCAALLVALNYHFVSDVIAGFFLGTACAVGVVGAARRRQWFGLL
jgi:membrane-associated phospholipid phosphatase